MKQVRIQIACSLAVSLLLPGLGWAFDDSRYLSQSLPPMQQGSYGTSGSGFTTYGQSQSQYGQYQTPYQQAPLQGYVVTAPAGTMVSATLASPVSSEFARVGDRFNATLGSPIAAGTSVVLPAGSQLEGQVMMVSPAGRTGKPGVLDIRFTGAMLPNGQRIAISARVQTEDGTGIIKGGTTKGRIGRAAMNTALGAGLGAALGTAMGPLSGGKVGRGAIYGTALGGGLGAIKAGFNKGDEAVLSAGQPVNIVLDQPLTTSPNTTSAPSGYGQYGGGSYGQQGNSYTQQQPYGNYYGQ